MKRIALALAWLACSLAPGTAASMPAKSAADFCNTIGVNIHAARSSSNGADLLRELAFLHVHYVRDTVHGANSQNPRQKLEAFKMAGVQWDLIVPDDPARYMAFLSANREFLSAVEGPNEPNFEKPRYQGLTGAAAGAAIQHDLYAAVRPAQAFKNLPVVNYAMGYHGAFIPTVNVAQDYDMKNLHAYAPQGLPPGAVVQTLADDMRHGGKLKLIVSETGYTTIRHNPAAPQNLEGVDEITQAKYLLDTLADDDAIGITKTYLYELQDDDDDPDNRYKEDHFGLFRHDGSAKPAALAIRNLILRLTATAPCTASFTPQALNVQINAPGLSNPPVHTLLLERCDHVYELLLWAEPVIWDHVHHIPRDTARQPVQVKLQPAQYTSTLFDPLSGSTAVANARTGGIDVAVPDHPVILQIQP